MIRAGMGSYFRPQSISSALAALAKRPSLLPLAGGTDYYPMRVVQPPDDAILDITDLPNLRNIQAYADHWLIPCLTTWTDIIESPLPPIFNGLKQAARQVGGIQIQNVGTLAGNVCNASPAADGIPCLLALQASVELTSTMGTRVLPLADFILGPRKTARRPDELLSRLRIPRPNETARSVFLKLGARHALIISIATVAAITTRTPDGRILTASIAIGSCAPTAQRLPVLEAALIGTTGDIPILDAHLLPLSPIDDIRATASYRHQAAATLISRALAA